MHPAHITILVVNILCGVFAYIGLFLFRDSLGQLGGISVHVGYFANLIAIVVSFVLIILLAIRFVSGKHRDLLSDNWLGIINGIFVVVFWVFAFVIWEAKGI